MRRALSPAALLLPLCAALAVAAWLIPWRSLVSCDCRTYLEMIRGVVDHGLPSTSNGPVADFPELRARWNSAVDGKLWGMYGPVYAYAAAPAYALDGVRGILRFNFALLVLLVFVFYRLCAVVLGDPRRAVVGPYLLLLATPVAGLAHAVSAYTLVPLLLSASAYFLCSAASRRSAALGGLLFGLAVATHVMVAPLALPLLVCVWRFGRQPLGATALGLLVGILPAIAFNLVKYGTPNPLAAAPCLWASCAPTGVERQNVGALLRFAGGPALVVALAVVAVVALRGRRALQALAVAIGAALLLAIPALREPTLRIARLALALLVDVGIVAPKDFAVPPDGRGHLMLDFAIKAALQSSPILIVGMFARPTRDVARFATWLAATTIGTLIAVLSLRAEMPASYAIGFPILHLRYLFPILPLAVLLVVIALDEVKGRALLVGVSAALAIGLVVWLGRGVNDLPTPRRLVILRLTLGSAALAIVGGALRSRRFAALLIAPALALSLAMTLGGDLRAWIRLRRP